MASVEQEMNEYIALTTELALLKEENARLKAENARLKWQAEAQD